MPGPTMFATLHFFAPHSVFMLPAPSHFISLEQRVHSETVLEAPSLAIGWVARSVAVYGSLIGRFTDGGSLITDHTKQAVV